MARSQRLYFALASGLLIVASATTAVGQDSDGDGVPNPLEQNGYRFNITSGDLESCDPEADVPCFVSDPLSWSSDGDPYSDYQEATGVNMDATVGVPYNSPLVAAYPVIEVAMHQYSFTSNATITDSQGNSITQGEEYTSSVESTSSVSVTVATEASFPGGVSASAETTAEYSETRSYSATTSTEVQMDWESATCSELNNAGTLFMSLFARNSGGATALNVRPTFNIFIGEDLIATVLPDEPFRQSLAPGEESAPVVPIVGGNPLGITLSFQRLRALQTGAPVTIEVVDILADIQRWRPEDSNWECGTGETCSWTSFQNQILPRTLRLIVDFGYTGDPEASIPFRFRDNPYEYRVYTGSPASNPDFSLRDVLRVIDYELEGSGSSFAINDRPYPSQWLLTAQADDQGYSPILQEWEMAGEPDDLMDVRMPPEATLLMSSPDPIDAGPFIRSSALTRDFLHVTAVANPKGSIPIVAAEAHIAQYGAERVVPMRLSDDGSFWTTAGSGAPSPIFPVGAATSFVRFTDRSGAVRDGDPLRLPVAQATTCADLEPWDLNLGTGTTNTAIMSGPATVFPTGDLDYPAEVWCDVQNDVTRFFVPHQPGPGGNGLYGAVFVNERVAIVVGNGVILRSEDGGRSWEEVDLGGAEIGAALYDVVRRPDTGTLIAVGGDGSAAVVFRSTDDGVTWTRQTETGTSRTMLAVDNADGDTWWMVGQDRIMVSTDDGITWVGAPSDPGTTGRRVSVAFRDESYGIVLDEGTSVAGTGRTWLTTDGGQTWNNVFTATGVTDVAYAGEDVWYITQRTPGGAVYAHRSPGNGAGGTWELGPIAVYGSTHPRDVEFVTPDLGYVADDSGILRTDDGGQHWTWEARISATVPRDVAVFDHNRAIVAGTSRWIMHTSSGGGHPASSVSVDDIRIDTPTREATIHLEPNYPNPFRDRTTLAYELLQPGEVELSVHDILGRVVARPVKAVQSAGRYEVPFEAGGLAAGTYFVRLLGGGATEVRKLVVVR